MEHTLFWQEGTWQATGIFRDDKKRDVRVSGQMDVQHLKNTWIAESFLEMDSDEPLRITNRYNIEAPDEDHSIASWTALNMALGPIKGHLVVVGDIIFSLFRTMDGQNGSESFRKLTDTHYHNKGFLLENDKVVSSWEIDWKKE